MDRFELAERRFHDIVGDDLASMRRGERYWKMPSSRIMAWIDDYVVPAIEEIYARPHFRDHATWPQRVLVKGSPTPERAAVEEIDQALVNEGRALRKLSGNKLVAQELDSMTPCQDESRPEEAITVDGADTTVNESVFDRNAHIPYYIAQTKGMSQRNWTDLVCINDYFAPVGGMMRTKPLPANVTQGEFVVSLNPRLFLLGDSITRSMLQRIRSLVSFLTEARQIFHEAVRKSKRSYKSQIQAEMEAYSELDRCYAELRRICATGTDACVREACIALVQVYAEFRPAPELNWLGIPDLSRARCKGMLRHNIESTRELETIERIAAAVSDVRRLYRESTPQHTAIDAAIGAGGLVLVRKGKEAYWEGKKIDQNWRRSYRKPWELLLKLAENARFASPVNDIDLYGRGVSPDTMYNRWHRLKPLLPASLRPLVEPGAVKASYVLRLPTNKIDIFESRIPVQ